jgi:hypothetical protein
MLLPCAASERRHEGHIWGGEVWEGHPSRCSLGSSLWLPFLQGVRVRVILWPTVSQQVCLGIKHPSGAYDHIFITVRQLRVCWCGALCLTRGRVCRLQLLLALASTIIFGSESHGTRDHILLSQIRDFPFCRLLRLAGLRWRFSTPPPHGRLVGGWILRKYGGRLWTAFIRLRVLK